MRLRIARRVAFGAVAFASSLTSACNTSSEATSSGVSVTDGGGGDTQALASAKLAARRFDEFAPWASPIDDYLRVGKRAQPGKFNASITELMPFGGRLFFGYGDADYNLGGRTPIEMRAFGSADDPAVVALNVEGAGQGAPQKTPRQSGEEQIDRYRILDGALFQAGIDSIDADELWTQANTTPKAIQGNVYRLEGDVFRKHRSIGGGEHVHDVASYVGSIFSVGSGADTRTEFEAGQIFRYLWRSNDRGATFETVRRVQNGDPGNSDTRWVHLLATSGKLFLFGYESTFSTNAADVRNAAYDGQSVVELGAGDALKKLIPDGTLALPDGTGLVWGVDLASGTPRYTAGHVGADGTLSVLASLAGSTVLDVSLTDTGEILFMTMAGDAYGDTPTPTRWDVRVLVADVVNPNVATELLHFTTHVRPVSLAHFGGALFLGTGDGKVMRATVSSAAAP